MSLSWAANAITRRWTTGHGIRMASAVLAMLLLSAPVQAQDEPAPAPDENGAMPVCGPRMDGQVFCRFGVLYECEYINPNSLDRRTGWRWKPDLLRACAAARVPATDGTGSAPIPEITYAPEDSACPAPVRPRHGPPNRDDEPQAGTMYVRPDGCPPASRPR